MDHETCIVIENYDRDACCLDPNTETVAMNAGITPLMLAALCEEYAMVHSLERRSVFPVSVMRNTAGCYGVSEASTACYLMYLVYLNPHPRQTHQIHGPRP